MLSHLSLTMSPLLISSQQLQWSEKKIREDSIALDNTEIIMTQYVRDILPIKFADKLSQCRFAKMLGEKPRMYKNTSIRGQWT